ncbi:presqualene diphosphate synthase HpnD [Castellaniella sp.]|uniref:presqualene diphosphate synthase HpnD n=1 Tax=Castellaniella sp. TaxID=1955812 RepID=UPI003A8D0289
MTPDDYCQQKAAQSGSSFYYSFLFLPTQQRHAITALYAFCREVDDIVDNAEEASVARMKLAWWRGQVDLMFDGTPDHPVAIALAPHIKTFGLESAPFYAIIEGMEMDLDQFRYDDWNALKEYCWRAAGVVGDLSARIFGYTDARTLQYAETLGLAFQMTNIIRDVGDDARRGRIYLPADEMQQHGVTVDDILDGHHTAAFEALMRQQTQRAQSLYRDAMRLLPETDRRAQRPGLMMAAIYHTLLGEIERDGWHVLNQRITITPIRKFWLAWKVWVGGGAGLIRRLSA